jgi:hypothetical protein
VPYHEVQCALRSSRPVVELVTHPAGGDLQQIAEALVERVPVAPVVRREAERHGGGDQKLLRRAAVPGVQLDLPDAVDGRVRRRNSGRISMVSASRFVTTLLCRTGRTDWADPG